MAESLLSLLDRLQQHVSRLAVLNAELKDENAALKRENESLAMKAEEAEKRRERAELDVEFLKVSHRLASDPDTIISTRRRIAGLIRNIDRCIGMLEQ